MCKYKVKLIVQGSIEIDEPIEANSEDEAVDIAVNEYANVGWYEFCGEVELCEDEENEE